MSHKESILAISVRQPWAELILRGEKTIEIRTWTDPYRGDLYLHTGKKADGYKHITFGMPDVFRGGYIGVIELAAILPFTPERWEQWKQKHLSNSPFKPGSYAWVIRKPRRFSNPIPGAGKLGLFLPDSEIMKKLQMEAFS